MCITTLLNLFSLKTGRAMSSAQDSFQFPTQPSRQKPGDSVDGSEQRSAKRRRISANQGITVCPITAARLWLKESNIAKISKFVENVESLMDFGLYILDNLGEGARRGRLYGGGVWTTVERLCRPNSISLLSMLLLQPRG